MIDDDDSLRAMISELLIEIGYELVGFASLDEVVDNASFRIGRDDLILIDLDARRAAELRAPLTSAFPYTVAITVGDGDYEAIPRVQLRKRARRARASQRARATRATGAN